MEKRRSGSQQVKEGSRQHARTAVGRAESYKAAESLAGKKRKKKNNANVSTADSGNVPLLARHQGMPAPPLRRIKGELYRT